MYINTTHTCKNGTSRSTCSFVVGVKDCLSTLGYMRSIDSNSGSWQATNRRNWCNGGFRQSLSDDLRPTFKQFNCITGTYNGTATGGTNVTTQDYFALFAEKELFNYTTQWYSTSNERNALTSIYYYRSVSGTRVKTRDGGATNWWMRSPYLGNSARCCLVRTDGSDYYNGVPSGTQGISPFGCV